MGSGICNSNERINLAIAPVAPSPVNITASEAAFPVMRAFTA